MGCLIKTPSNAGYLYEKKILDNYFGTDKEVSQFFNNLGKDVAIDVKQCYLAKVFVSVDKYYNSGLHVQFADLQHTYHNIIVPALATFILLLLTLVQAFFAIYPYIHPPQSLMYHITTL